VDAACWCSHRGGANRPGKPYDKGTRPLHNAVEDGDGEAVRQAGACPDASDAVWWVELIVNAVEGDEEAVTALVRGAQSSVGFR
jgi:hypothetical protein